MQRIKSIAWFENDMGFASTGVDGSIYFYDLYGKKEKEQKRNEDKDFRTQEKDIKFHCVSIIPGSATPYEVLGVGTDAQIHHTSGKKECKVAPDWQLSQVVVHRNGRSFFTGVGERDVPGAIQIWRMDDKSKFMERTNEI